MNQIIKVALVANAASLGLNWIYNLPYMERLDKQGEITFQPVDPAKYKRARKADMAYPNAQVGDVSLQGEILKWLYEALKDNPDLTQEEYATVVYQKIKPGGTYEGWVETYGKKLIFNKTIEEFELNREKLTMDDDQLIGLIPYIATKALGLSNAKAWELAQAFTNNEDYPAFYDVFDALIDDLKTMNMQEALKHSLEIIPKQYGFKLSMALNANDPKDILQIVKTSGSIGYAIPLIYTILTHSHSFENAVKLNTKFSGASSDRGTLIGALYATIADVPKDWIDKTNF